MTQTRDVCCINLAYPIPGHAGKRLHAGYLRASVTHSKLEARSNTVEQFRLLKRFDDVIISTLFEPPELI